jgi:glutamyl/glutaminyl-tRNA synthetase
VLRAEEHISNTPRQILIQEALDFPRPIYGHFPLILAPDRSKLSKRKHGASIENYRGQGFLPEATINYLALLGWNPGTEQEMFSMPELISAFTLEGVQKAGAMFDIQKYRWFNREYMKAMGESEFKREASDRLAKAGMAGDADRLVPLLKERVEVWGDVETMFAEGGELYFAAHEPNLDSKKIAWKGEGVEAAAKHLARCRELLENAPAETFSNADAIKALIWPYAEEMGRGSVLWPLRYSLTGQEKSPDPFTVAHVLGKEKTVGRIDVALDILRG